MSEGEFITQIVLEADCLLHLDVNNIYVISRNFGFDPITFMDALPLERTCYVHVAGHYVEPDGLVVDTHGAAVIDPVWTLLAAACARVGGNVPICLERDFNIPDLAALTAEVGQIARLQAPARAISSLAARCTATSRTSSAPSPATCATRTMPHARRASRPGACRFTTSCCSTTSAAFSTPASRSARRCSARSAGAS